MRFLADQDVYAVRVRFLSGLGHEVVSVRELGLSQANDADLLRIARQQRRILITRDRDLGGLVFVRRLGAGVIYLRVLPSTQALVHAELERILATYTEERLLGAFVVVEPARHRFRKVPD